jgi:hypothetical protein
VVLVDLWYQLTPDEQDEIEILGQKYNEGFRREGSQ